MVIECDEPIVITVVSRFHTISLSIIINLFINGDSVPYLHIYISVYGRIVWKLSTRSVISMGLSHFSKLSQIYFNTEFDYTTGLVSSLHIAYQFNSMRERRMRRGWTILLPNKKKQVNAPDQSIFGHLVSFFKYYQIHEFTILLLL